MCFNSFKMKKRKLSQYIEIKELRRLENDPSSCVERKKFEHHLSLYPAQLSDLKGSIKYLLNSSLAKYDKRKDGILLGYENVKVLRQEGDINYDTCFIHIDAEVDFFIFKPKIGLIVNGVVNKTCSTHIGCLVHNMFNVSILRPNNDKNWIGQKVVLRQEVRIRITGLQLESRLPYITGEIISFLSEDSGISTSEETGPGFNKIGYEDIKPNKNESSSYKKHKPTKTSLTIEGNLEADSRNIITSKGEDSNQLNFKKRKIKREEAESGENDTNSFATVKVEDAGHVKKRRRSKSVSLNDDEYIGDVPLRTIKKEKKSNEFTSDQKESNVCAIKRSKSICELDSIRDWDQLNANHESDVAKDKKERKRSKSLSKNALYDHVEMEPVKEKRIRSKSVCSESRNNKHDEDLLVDGTTIKVKRKTKSEGMYQAHISGENVIDEFENTNFIIDTVGNTRDSNIKRKKSKSLSNEYGISGITLENDMLLEQKSPSREYLSKIKEEKKSPKISTNEESDLKAENVKSKKKRKLDDLSNEGDIDIELAPKKHKKLRKSETIKENKDNKKPINETTFDSRVLMRDNSNANNEAANPKKHKNKYNLKEYYEDEKQEVNVASVKKHKKKSKQESAVDSNLKDTSFGSLPDINLRELFQEPAFSPGRVPMADDADKGKKYTRSPHSHAAIVIDTSVAFPEDTDIEEITKSCKKKKKKHKRTKHDMDGDAVTGVEYV